MRVLQEDAVTGARDFVTVDADPGRIETLLRGEAYAADLARYLQVLPDCGLQATGVQDYLASP